MTTEHALVLGLFVSLFGCAYTILAPGSNEISPLDKTSDRLVKALVQDLERNEGKHQMTMLDINPSDLLKTSVAAGFLLGAGLVFTLWLLEFMDIVPIPRIMLLFPIPLGVLATPAIAQSSLATRFKDWQNDLSTGLVDLVDFMPVFLSIPGITGRQALVATVPRLPEPLRSEIHKAVNTIKEGRVQEAFSSLAQRARLPLLDAVCYRLATNWETTLSPDLFLDLKQDIDSQANEAAANKTAKKKATFVMIAILCLFVAMFFLGYPALMYVAKTFSAQFGG